MVARSGLLLRTDSGDFVAQSDSYMFFIDDTGTSSMKDVKYPVFGLGGCGFIIQEYVDNYRPKWNTVRKEINGGKEALHATDLEMTSKKGIKMIAGFFSASVFARLCAITSEPAYFERGILPVEVVCKSLQQRMLEVLNKRTLPYLREVHIVFESGHRTDKEVKNYFTGFDKLRRGRQEIKINFYLMKKSSLEAGIEIADFIMHASGNQVKMPIKKQKRKKRKDWSCIWDTKSKNISSFMNITSAVRN